MKKKWGSVKLYDVGLQGEQTILVSKKFADCLNSFVEGQELCYNVFDKNSEFIYFDYFKKKDGILYLKKINPYSREGERIIKLKKLKNKINENTNS